ncbi:hypothetical protein PUNSTDRAFT_100283 [Punctularia strigosozonata HHB-11173 SS5]|uniref:uncharacterized protein n=1 Tax=Punctularia strigosozonata (strain HHB-11173) TaxID=741275 RepID=UPI0004417A20|nr:uncharacterized protein PUNSTDRAFT_100283 [Punctularia strigosozonata HHB-11173 SS5]EIN10627.1 hypothetical protein PUNSTDRAFT_100283 [Punctularia strigosozonata HHB-11173 SS5]
MDRYLAPHTPEAQAHFHFTENGENWDFDAPHVDEKQLASCAVYSAFARYLSGTDLYIPPRNRKELESVLRRYSHDAIHNLIASSPRSQATLQPGGYSRMCQHAELSIRNVINSNDNGTHLIELHRSTSVVSTDMDRSPSRSVKIQ